MLQTPQAKSWMTQWNAQTGTTTASSPQEKLQEMADALSAKLKGYDALMPTFRSTGDIVPMPDELAGRTAICPSDIQPTSQGH